MRTHLYRHFSADGTLLYVGISMSALIRLSQHKVHSAWFDNIRSVTIELFDSRKDGLEAERRAIETELPKHNIIYKKDIVVIKEEAKECLSQRSAENLITKVVNFDVWYSIDDLPVPLRRGQIIQYMDEGKLGFFELPNNRQTKMNRYVTGWQLIDFFEWLELQPNNCLSQKINERKLPAHRSDV